MSDETLLSALPHASDKLPVSHPRFDKGRDTRFSPSRWPRSAVPGPHRGAR